MATVELERVVPAITIVRLNRPDRLNAMSYELVGDLHDALDEVAADHEAKVAVLTGAGRGFCAGLDLAGTGDPPKAGEHRRATARTNGQTFIADLVTHLRATPQIVVAAVNGPAYGGGLAIACAADVRIAAESARFCSAFIRTGLSGTDIGISWLLPRLVGVSRAFDLIISGRAVDAAEADRMGLVSQVVPDADLMDHALDYAGLVAGHTRTGLLLTKEVLWHNLETASMEAAIAMENRNQLLASRSEEVQAFMANYARRITGAGSGPGSGA